MSEGSSVHFAATPIGEGLPGYYMCGEEIQGFPLFFLLPAMMGFL